MDAKYARIQDYNKPVVIAEAGVTGTDAYKQAWLEKATSDMHHYPLLKGMVYFNKADLPGAWGKDLGVADFSINAKSLNPLVESAKKQTFNVSSESQ